MARGWVPAPGKPSVMDWARSDISYLQEEKPKAEQGLSTKTSMHICVSFFLRIFSMVFKCLCKPRLLWWACLYTFNLPLFLKYWSSSGFLSISVWFSPSGVRCWYIQRHHLMSWQKPRAVFSSALTKLTHSCRPFSSGAEQWGGSGSRTHHTDQIHRSHHRQLVARHPLLPAHGQPFSLRATKASSLTKMSFVLHWRPQIPSLPLATHTFQK